MNKRTKAITKFSIFLILFFNLFLLKHLELFSENLSESYVDDPLVNIMPSLRLDPELDSFLKGSSNIENLVPNQILVQVNDSENFNSHIGYLEDKYGIVRLESYPLLNLVLFRDPNFQKVRSLVADPVVSSVWGNHISPLSNIPEIDANFKNSQLNLVDFNSEIGANKLKRNGINGSSVTIAFLDTGVDITGQLEGGDLDDFDENTTTNDFKFYGATSLAPDDPFYYSDFSGRGTWHAGLACGTGYYNKTFEGVAPGAKYLSVKVFDPFGITYYSSLISGVEWAIKNSADIILFSADIPGLPNDPISKACDEAVERGVLVVAPSGNEGPSYMSVSSPGHSLKALTVGAYDSYTGTIANFSSRGPILFDFRQGVDLIAPGVGLIGTRANVIPPGTLEGETASLMPRPTFGDEIQENYSRASGTGGAAALVAGAAALLLQEFPQASPEILRVALTTTAVQITGDRSAEGNGLVNVNAAREFLLNYFESRSVDVFPIPSQALYTGLIMAPDSLNISQQPERPENWSAIDALFSITTHSISSVLFLNQTDFANASAIHLLFSVWGVGYNGEFHWLPEFRIVKELYQATLQPLGTSQYYRYVGILSDDRIYVVMAIETWSYTDSQEQRITGFNFEFTIINIGEEIIENVSIANVCKADLYLDEYNISLDNLSEISTDMQFANDDVMSYNETSNMLMLNDANQTRTSGEYNNTALLFTSFSHKPSQWEISDFFTILLNITMQQPLQNQVDYIQNEEDPAWGFVWNITDSLYPSAYQTFEAQLTAGLGNNTIEATESAIKQMNFLYNNVTTGSMVDLQIIEPSFHRIINVNNRYNTQTRVINVGTEAANETAIIFLVNRSNQIDRFELFAIVQEYDKIELFDFLDLDAEWFPIYEDTYTLAWIASLIQETEENITALAELAGVANLLPEALPDIFTTTPLITSYQARNAVVVNGSYYQAIAQIFARSSPSVLDLAPMIPQFPGDIAIWNITYISCHNLSNIHIIVQGTVSNWLTINYTYYDILEPFTTILCSLSIPLMAGPGEYELSINFVKNNNIFLTVPLKFIIHAMTGRIWYDAIHNNITISLSDDEINFGWDERLDTPYGNFYDLKSFWAKPTMFNLSGTSLQPLMTGMIDINLTEMGLDLGELEEMSRFLPDSLKGLSFRGDILSTSYLDTNILQLGDILILSDPEIPYLYEEIRNITSFVSDGGVVFFWIEPENENNWTSINELLSEFGLEINSTTNISKYLLKDQNLSPITNLDLTLQMSNPVSLKQIDNPPHNATVSFITSYISCVEYGRGKVCVIGDNGLFNNTGLKLADNKIFAQKLLKWALNQQAELKIHLKNSKIKHGESVYFDVEITNFAEIYPYLKEGYLWIYSFSHENGTEITPISQSNQSLPLNPIFPGEEGHFLAQFKSEWTNMSGTFYVIFYFDHKAIVSKIFFASFFIYESSLPPVIDYDFPVVPYEHIFDFVLLTAIVGLFLLQRQYRASKWGRRFRIIELKEPIVLYEARTYLAEAEMLSKSLNQALLHSKYSEIERIRFLLRIRKRFNQLFDKVRNFGDRLGEV